MEKVKRAQFNSFEIVLTEDVQSEHLKFTVKFEGGVCSRFQAVKRVAGDLALKDVVKDALRIYEFLVSSEAAGIPCGYLDQGVWRQLEAFGLESIKPCRAELRSRSMEVEVSLNPELHTRFRALKRHTGAYSSEQVVLDALRRFEDLVAKETRGVEFGYRDESGWHSQPIFQG